MAQENRPVTTTFLQRMKQRGTKIVALTAYDATFARLEDEAGIDVMLVGDSLGMVVQGHADTLPVTIEDIVYHTRACRRGIKRALLVADMPFLSYQVTPEEALRNAGRCMKEGAADTVKLEGGVSVAATIRRLVDAGIPVMAHIGMQPQMVNVYGGFKLRGRKKNESDQIKRDADAIQEAGAYAVVLEKVSRGLAADITKQLDIPTIGIASGPDCDGQILVNYDMLGLSDQYHFKFVREYAKLGDEIREVVKKYGDEIRSGSFPSDDESFE